eukprot:TRINITY_DN3766_c0_g1_i1.p3 TRINITY_DN3766_c0_g1~~TRINITY_DN3766_c0_g1_i1.p3  ORF type:complete len:50 (-),score=2.60 TRINITY_DN3766_c0_g1_i1:137-286(-)
MLLLKLRDDLDRMQPGIFRQSVGYDLQGLGEGFNTVTFYALTRLACPLL